VRLPISGSGNDGGRCAVVGAEPCADPLVSHHPVRVVMRQMRADLADAALAHNAERLRQFLASRDSAALWGMSWQEFREAAQLLIEQGGQASALLARADAGKDEWPSDTVGASRTQRAGSAHTVNLCTPALEASLSSPQSFSPHPL